MEQATDTSATMVTLWVVMETFWAYNDEWFDPAAIEALGAYRHRENAEKECLRRERKAWEECIQSQFQYTENLFMRARESEEKVRVALQDLGFRFGDAHDPAPKFSGKITAELVDDVRALFDLKFCRIEAIQVPTESLTT
jgi:hypothetical protein